MPKLKVDIVASSNMDNDLSNNIDRLQGEPFAITHAGEFEVQGIFLYGVQLKNGNTAYVIDAEGITLAHLGTDPQELGDDELELFESVDILLLPVSGDKKVWSTVIQQIEPRIIIPMQFKTGGVKAKLDTIDAFAKEMGIKDTTGENKLIIKKSQLPAEETQVHILQPA